MDRRAGEESGSAAQPSSGLSALFTHMAHYGEVWHEERAHVARGEINLRLCTLRKMAHAVHCTGEITRSVIREERYANC